MSDLRWAAFSWALLHSYALKWQVSYRATVRVTEWIHPYLCGTTSEILEEWPTNLVVIILVHASIIQKQCVLTFL